ncbi:MAG TPA: lipoprotein, partial [Sphingobacteriaceae bacterium]
MKKIVLAATAIALLSACTSTQSSESTGSSASPAEAAAPADLAGAPVMKFEEEQYDFGTIT